MISNIFLIGPMGAGKTTIGKSLAQALDLDFYDSDREIENRTGTNLAWIYDLEGEGGLRMREESVIDDLTKKSKIVLATGGSVVLSPKNRKILEKRGTVCYLQASVDQQIERIKKVSDKRPLLRVDDNLKGKIEELHEVLERHYAQLADYVFSTDKLNVKSVVNTIINTLNL